jgi:putative NIF3 family GTP cyclohydrolase 1 type 2
MPRVVEAVVAAHPYEEVAYDRYPLAMRSPSADYGLGMVGEMSMLAGETLHSFAQHASEAFRTDYLQAIGPPEKAINRVAVCSGAGNFSVSTLRGDECDVLVTGEITYHAAVEARHKGLAVVCVGHFASEVLVAEAMAEHLMKQVPGLEAKASKASSDPIWIP